MSARSMGLALLLAGCTASLPDARFRCTEDSDCPPALVCDRTISDGRCVRNRLDAATADASRMDSAVADGGVTCTEPCDESVAGCCARECVDLQTDVDHCGGCGVACPPDNQCQGGRCALACTDPLLGDCNFDAADGCEQALDTIAHCGACARGCAPPNATGQCRADGTCAIAACDEHSGDCDGVVSNGCETDLRIDPAHCSRCTANCALANTSSRACVDSACAVVTCEDAFGDCDAVASTGCETDLRTTFAHCGACGRSCMLRGTTTECRDRSCAITGCEPGFVDCNGVASDGCEAFLASSTLHCGRCGNPCGPGQGCTNGGCCMLGFDFCPGSGCRNTASDLGHCGRCGNACAPGLRCFDYECVP